MPLQLAADSRAEMRGRRKADGTVHREEMPWMLRIWSQRPVVDHGVAAAAQPVYLLPCPLRLMHDVTHQAIRMANVAKTSSQMIPLSCVSFRFTDLSVTDQ